MLDKKQFPWEQEGFAEFRAWIAANPIAGSSPACSFPEAIEEATATEILVSQEPDRRSACEVGFSVSSPHPVRLRYQDPKKSGSHRVGWQGHSLDLFDVYAGPRALREALSREVLIVD
jgi:hypothetical protein